MAARNIPGGAPMSFQEAAQKFKIEDNARGFVEATVMPYLTAGFEELLNVAKERGELKVLGEGEGVVDCLSENGTVCSRLNCRLKYARSLDRNAGNVGQVRRAQLEAGR